MLVAPATGCEGGNFLSFFQEHKGQERRREKRKRNGCSETPRGVKMKNHGSPDDEGASDLQQSPFAAEPPEKVDHELIKVGVHGGSGGRTF